jgi:hypothetical protein
MWLAMEALAPLPIRYVVLSARRRAKVRSCHR